MKVWYGDLISNKEFFSNELNYYFGKVFGEFIEIESKQENADLKILMDSDHETTDRICIELSNGKGTIKSNSQCGLLIALYRFFKEFGVRYLRPGKKMNELLLTVWMYLGRRKFILMKQQASNTEVFV